MAGLNKYQAYPEYRDSGVEWLGEIPRTWQAYTGKRLFSSVRTPALSNDEQLAASQKYGVIPQTLMMQLNDSKVMLALKGTDSFRHVEKNNFVISLRSFEGGIEHSNYQGCVSPAYTVLKSVNDISFSFYRYLLKSEPYISALQASTDSLRDGKSINYEQFGAITLPSPSLPEQSIIAHSLDHETAKIDNLIEKQQQLIELLKEKRQAVISHAVTKGLNPDVPMKDSGVEWLDEIPEHWRICKLKNLAKICNGQDYKLVQAETGYPVIGSGGQFAWANTFLYDKPSVLLGRKGTIDKPLYIDKAFWTVDTMYYTEVFD
ncbi:restriction endonuclease subunit S, partial [Escherichia coli]